LNAGEDEASPAFDLKGLAHFEAGGLTSVRQADPDLGR
jgi:hypothetical protein